MKVSDESLVTANNDQEKEYPCHCGYNGPIANHLRAYPQCVEVLKEQVGMGAEMLDDQFCIKVALLVGQCPAVCCPGGDHTEIPDICVKWWKSTGWEVMKWGEQASGATSALIKERSSEFVKHLESNEAQQQKQINQSGRNEELDGSFASFNPPLFSTPKESNRDERSIQTGEGSLPDMVK